MTWAEELTLTPEYSPELEKQALYQVLETAWKEKNWFGAMKKPVLGSEKPECLSWNFESRVFRVWHFQYLAGQILNLNQTKCSILSNVASRKRWGLL